MRETGARKEAFFPKKAEEVPSFSTDWLKFCLKLAILNFYLHRRKKKTIIKNNFEYVVQKSGGSVLDIFPGKFPFILAFWGQGLYNILW